jgi:RNA polymerase sigma-70 factor (ECF subfamily)
MDLIERCRAGDRAAFGELYEQYKNLVYRTAYLMMDDPDDAEEALQEIFVLLFRTLPAYQQEKSAFSTWLHRVTINYCINIRHRQKLLTHILDRFQMETKIRTSGASTAAEEREAVRTALRRLSPPLRVVIVLRYYHGLSYAEIGAILELPEGTVKSRLNLAHQKLRDYLKMDFFDFSERQGIADELPTS